MDKDKKILLSVLQGNADANIAFSDICRLLCRFGFQERIRGSHHVFFKDRVKEILNLQPKGGKAKPYQVKQVRNIILAYKLSL